MMYIACKCGLFKTIGALCQVLWMFSHAILFNANNFEVDFNLTDDETNSLRFIIHSRSLCQSAFSFLYCSKILKNHSYLKRTFISHSCTCCVWVNFVFIQDMLFCGRMTREPVAQLSIGSYSFCSEMMCHFHSYFIGQNNSKWAKLDGSGVEKYNYRVEND